MKVVSFWGMYSLLVCALIEPIVSSEPSISVERGVCALGSKKTFLLYGGEMSTLHNRSRADIEARIRKSKKRVISVHVA